MADRRLRIVRWSRTGERIFCVPKAEMKLHRARDRAFEKTLQTLMQMQVKSEQGEADQTDVTEGDSSTEPQAEEDEPEVENITPQAENAPSARDSSSGLTMGTTEEAVPECGSKAAGAENSIPAGEMGGAA